MNRKSAKRLAVVLVLATVAGCSGAGRNVLPVSPNAATVATGRSPQRDVVADVVLRTGSAIHDLGRAPSNLQLSIAVTLRYRNEPQLEQFITAQETLPPGVRHHWLTDEQFDARYAPAQGDYSRVVASLRSAGLRVTRQFENRTVVDAEGNVGALEAYFGTQIHRVAQPGYGMRFANVRPAYAPANLRGLLVSVDGLSTLSLVHVLRPPSSTGAANAPHPRGDPASRLFGPANPTRPNSIGYAPAAFIHAYDFPSAHAKSYDGSGHAVGFVMDADFSDGDVTTFLKYFGIKRANANTKRVPINGGAPPGDEAVDTIYSTFVAENVAGLVPGAKLYAYEIHPGFALNDVTDAFNDVVSDNRVDVVAAAFGSCEAAIPKTAEAWSAIAEQGLAKGIVFAAGSGDNGGIRCTEIPASSPNFTAIGGTSLTIGPRGVWFSEPADLFSSGGMSTLFAMPAWQKGVAGTVAGGRNLPDVAFDSFPTVGAAGYLAVNGGWTSGINPFSGTGLLAASIYASAVVQVDELKNERTGLASEKLFDVWKTVGYGTSARPYFHDATEGGSGLYFAKPGYDFVTGIGSVDVWNLAQQL